MSFHDDFERDDTTAGLGTSSSGHVWDTRFFAKCKIVDGRYVPNWAAGNVASYARIDAGETPTRMAATVSLSTGVSSPNNGWALISSHGRGGDGIPFGNGAYNNMLHFTFFQSAWSLNVYEDGLPGATLASGLLNLLNDGTTYDFAIDILPGTDTVVITLPDGTQTPVTNAAFRRVVGPKLVYELIQFEAAQTSLPRMEAVSADIGDTAVPAESFGVTRKELRRLIAGTHLSDLLVLVATVNGSTTTFRDDIELTDSQGAYVGSQGLVTGGTYANVGKVVRVKGSDEAAHTLTFEPALPSPVVDGDEMELVRLNGRGWRFQEYHRAINDVLAEDFAETLIERVEEVGTLDAASPTVAIPQGMSHVFAVEFKEPSVAGAEGDWCRVRRARAAGVYGNGYWLDRANRQVTISGKFRDAADGLVVRVRGFGRHPALERDSDVCLCDPEWLAREAAARLALQSPDRAMRELGALLVQQADRREQNSRRSRPSNTLRIR